MIKKILKIFSMERTWVTLEQRLWVNTFKFLLKSETFMLNTWKSKIHDWIGSLVEDSAEQESLRRIMTLNESRHRMPLHEENKDTDPKLDKKPLCKEDGSYGEEGHLLIFISFFSAFLRQTWTRQKNLFWYYNSST